MALDLRPVALDNEHTREMRAAKELSIPEAIASVQCASCQSVIEDDATAPHCRNCDSYWADVASGMFDDALDEVEVSG